MVKHDIMDKIMLRTTKYQYLLYKLLSQEPVSPRDRINLPDESGVYRIFKKPASSTMSLYVGEGNILDRIYHGHLMGNKVTSPLKKKLPGGNKSIKQFISQDCLVQFLIIRDPIKRKRFEHFAISILNPPHND